MLGLLENIEEYNNAGALLGIDGNFDEELLGALKRVNPVQRQKLVNKITSTGARSRGSRAEMEKHFAELPAHIKSGLSNKDLRLADSVIYSIKPVSSKTIKLFETQDDKEVGLRNISNAKLPKNQALLVSGIWLLVGKAETNGKDKIIGTKFGKIEDYPAIANGEFSLKCNKKQIVPETPNVIFKTDQLHKVPVGYYKLANPRLIHDDMLIEMVIELGSMEGIQENTFIYAGLHGTITTP
ncbi:MAG: hypothetical protein JNM95_12110 [Chitinophagaceae bacterium]|nr:hypothetical protein [Chitinophagaceae bacterium]